MTTETSPDQTAEHNEDLVAGAAVPPPPTADEQEQIDRLYGDFDSEHMVPLWTQIGDLMPMTPKPQAVPHVWKWQTLLPLAARYGIETTYGSLDEALADDRVHALSLCTANASHATLAVTALDAGRHVLVEKPLATTLEAAVTVAAAAARSGTVVQVGFVRRFSGNVRTLKRFVDAGDLGQIYYARASNLRRAGHPGGWYGDRERSGGGPLIDIGSHVLDLCWYLMGRPEPVSVSGNTYAWLGERAGLGPQRYRATEAGPGSTVEDLANASIRFANGASLLLDASY